MSTSPFLSVRKVHGRKQHVCEHCRKVIETGALHWYTAGMIEGEFTTYREHFECRSAWYTLNFELRSCAYDEGAPFLADDEHEEDDRAWMREQFPKVAERLGWTS